MKALCHSLLPSQTLTSHFRPLPVIDRTEDMASFATDGFRFTHTENRRSLRNCASNNRFTAQARTSPPTLPPPLLSGETVACEEDGIETQIEDLEGETQVLDGGREMCVRDQVLMANLEGETQVVDDLRDGLEMDVGNVGGETQVWDDFGGQTQVDDTEYGYDMELINLGAETEVQDDEDCVRNVCSQFLRSGVDFDLAGGGGTSNESGIVKGVFCDSSTSLVNEKKQGQSYGKPLDQDSNYVSATPPTTVDLDLGSFQRSFTSIRTASLRASGLAARCKALVETGISAPHAPVQNDYEISSVGHIPRSAHNHDIAEQGVNNDASMCKPVCSVVRKLFNEEPLAENRNIANEGDGEEGANTPQLPLPDNDDEVAGLSYVGSQEPGDSTQAEAFDFIERFVNDNASDMLLEADNVPERRTISKPTSSAKSFLKFSKKSTVLRQPVDQAVSFNWDEELEDEGGGDFFCRMKEKIFKGGHKQRSLPQPQKSRRCVELVGDKSDKMKFCDKRTVTQSDSKLLLFNLDRNSKVIDTAKANIRRSLETELNGELPIRCTEEPTEAIARRNDIQAMFSVGPDTQIAAEAMEALFGGEPISSADADANANANQWNSASLSAADSKSRQSAKIREFREKGSSDGSVIQKSQRKINEKKKKKIHGTILNGHGKDEVNGTHTPNRSCLIDKANPFMSGCRATRSMVQNQGNMLLNQAVVAQNISKDTSNETNLQIGVAIPKGKRSRNCLRTEAKYDKTHSDVGQVKLDDSILHESRPNVKTSGAMTSSRRQSARHLRSHLVKSPDYRKLKSKKEANKTSSNMCCNEGSSSKRFVTSPARASCSFDAADICRDVVRTNILDNHSAKGTAVDAADCGMPVEVVGAVPITDKPSQRSSNPPESACAISDKHSEIRNARAGDRCRRQLPINLSRSSLRKEISALLSNSPKSLSDLKRKRREMNEVRILFSNHLDDDALRHQKKILARLGASLAFSISDATHFVADSFLRTRNMLEAMALGKPVVTHLWLESCNQTSCLIDEKAYILRDAKKERELGFSMPDSLVRASQKPLLQNQKVIITPNSKPSKDIVANLVKAVHGEVVENFDLSSLKVDEYPGSVLILSCQEDYVFCQSYLNEGVAVHSSELLLSGIVTQRLDYARHRLFEDHVRTAVSQEIKISKRL